MKKFNLWLLSSLFVSAFMFTACSSSDSDGGGQGGGGDLPIPPIATKAAISGVVYNWGAPVSGVKVTVGTSSVITGYNGAFTFNQVSGNTVKFEKEGFATITRQITQTNQHFDVSLTEVQTTTFPASTAKTLDIDYTGTKVALPASFKDESGNAYTGNVTAKSAYLTPADADFADKMPGDLSAIRSDQSEAALISYGMISVELTGDAGQKLQPGSPATLTFPLTNGVDPVATPSIPLWSFNEEKGLWEEEGVATYDAILNAYVGTVTHFSWHNLDWPEARATLNAKVVDNAGNPIVGVPVDFDGQRTAYTNADGIASCVVPSNTKMLIKVNSEAYGNYAEVFDEYGWPSIDETKIVKQNVTLNPQETKTITLQMPAKAPVISGKVINEGSGSNICTLFITYGKGIETARVITDLDGSFSITAPANYRGAGKIIVTFGDGYKVEQDIQITDADQTVNITANSNSPASAGVIVVTGDGLNTRYLVAPPTGGIWENAVSISEGTLNFEADLGGENKNLGWGHVYIAVPNYDESQASFTTNAGTFEYFMEGGSGWTNLSTSSRQGMGEETITVNVKKEGDVYTFTIANQNAFLIDRSLGFDWDNTKAVKMSVEISGKKVVDTPK